MLSAANENVLMAVGRCWDEREPATIGAVTGFTSPRLSVDEATTILKLLHGDGYLHTERAAIDQPRGFVPTVRGHAAIKRAAIPASRRTETTDDEEGRRR